MLNKNQLIVFRFLWQAPDQLSSISGVSRRTSLAYPLAWKALKELEKKTIVKVIKEKSHLYSLDLDSEFCFSFWEFWNAIKKQELRENPKYGNYADAMDFITRETSPGFAVIFGSVAKKKADKESDLDVLVCKKKDFDTEKIAKEVEVRYFIQAAIVKATKSELSMQLKKKKEVYKEIWQDGIAWNGTKQYFDAMKELWG